MPRRDIPPRGSESADVPELNAAYAAIALGGSSGAAWGASGVTRPPSLPPDMAPGAARAAAAARRARLAAGAAAIRVESPGGVLQLAVAEDAVAEAAAIAKSADARAALRPGLRASAEERASAAAATASADIHAAVVTALTVASDLPTLEAMGYGLTADGWLTLPEELTLRRPAAGAAPPLRVRVHVPTFLRAQQLAFDAATRSVGGAGGRGGAAAAGGGAAGLTEAHWALLAAPETPAEAAALNALGDNLRAAAACATIVRGCSGAHLALTAARLLAGDFVAGLGLFSGAGLVGARAGVPAALGVYVGYCGLALGLAGAALPAWARDGVGSASSWPFTAVPGRWAVVLLLPTVVLALVGAAVAVRLVVLLRRLEGAGWDGTAAAEIFGNLSMVPLVVARGRQGSLLRMRARAAARAAAAAAPPATAADVARALAATWPLRVLLPRRFRAPGAAPEREPAGAGAGAGGASRARATMRGVVAPEGALDDVVLVVRPGARLVGGRAGGAPLAGVGRASGPRGGTPSVLAAGTATTPLGQVAVRGAASAGFAGALAALFALRATRPLTLVKLASAAGASAGPAAAEAQSAAASGGGRTVLVTGATGLLGRALVDVFRAAGWSVVGAGFSRGATRVDIRSPESVNALFAAARPSVVVHAAAERRPDVCEKDVAGSEALNVVGVWNVARAAAARDCGVIYISTDYLFDGTAAPYSEHAPTSPLNAYGALKLRGEHAALAGAAGAVVLRVPLLYGPTHDLTESACTAFAAIARAADRPATVDDWQIRVPTYTPDVAATCVRIADALARPPGEGGAARPAGVYHYSAPERFTRWGLVRAFAELMGGLPTAHVTRVEGRPPGAPRPYDCHLSCARLVDAGLFAPPTPFAVAAAEVLRRLPQEAAREAAAREAAAREAAARGAAGAQA